MGFWKKSYGKGSNVLWERLWVMGKVMGYGKGYGLWERLCDGLRVMG